MKFEDIDFKDAPKNGFIMASYISGVEFGRYENETYAFKDKYPNSEVLEIHIFNKDKEFRVIKVSNNDFIVKLIDGKNKNGIEDEYIEEGMMFFGQETFVKSENGVTTLKERGVKKDFYFSLTKEQHDKLLRLKVRNYIEYDEDDMIYIKNYRIVGLYSGEEEL